MKRIIDWFKSSNHPHHIALCGVGTMLLMAVGAFIYRPLWHNALEAVATMAVVGVAIEVYQAIVSRTFNGHNSIGDILADVVGIALGVGAYALLTLAPTEAAIMLMVTSLVSCLLAFALPKHKWKFLWAFLGCLIVGFSLFTYAQS
jgi:hypothetical protein